MRCWIKIALATVFLLPTMAKADDLAAAVLPSSRSALVGQTVTAFATVINTSGHALSGCTISLPNFPGTFTFQTTDPSTNAVTGTPNAAFGLAANASQTLVVALTPRQALPPTDEHLVFGCALAASAPSVVGLNTLLLSADVTQPPDVVALAATLSADGVLRIPSATGQQALAVATVNVGAAAAITASADTGDIALPIQMKICQTNPMTGVCLAAPSDTVTTSVGRSQTPTFAVFATAQSALPFFPAVVRTFVRFKDSAGATRGSTSVALNTSSVLQSGQTAGGFYKGIARETAGANVGAISYVEFLVSEDGEMRGVSLPSPSSADVLTLFTTQAIANTNLSYAGTGTLLPANGYVLTGVSSTALAVNGAVSPHQFIVGSYAIGGGTLSVDGEFAAAYQQAIYERPSSLAAVAGAWTIRDFNANAIGQLQVANTGSFTGSDLYGCNYSGTVSLIDTRYNAYRIGLNVSGCAIASFSGLGGLFDGRSANDSLQFELSSGSVAETSFITRY